MDEVPLVSLYSESLGLPLYYFAPQPFHGNVKITTWKVLLYLAWLCLFVLRIFGE